MTTTAHPWLGEEIKVLPPHGYILPVDFMGDDVAITRAARVSYGRTYTEEKAREASPRRLLRYLMRHHHTSPFEMCELKLEVQAPLFVARQWVR